MTQIRILCIALLAAGAFTQTCLPSALIAQYGLTSQSAAVVNNGTCKFYFSSNGACATPWSVINAMNNHNAWLATKALDAQQYGLQYINATVYWQTVNGFVNANTQVQTNTSWWQSFTNTLSNWWTAISNRATALFNSAYGWLRSVFSNHVAGIPSCLNAWGNITNGAYCLAGSSHSIPYTVANQAANTGAISWGVLQSQAGSALNNCLPLIDTYCQLTYGISINNNSSPFNQTFSWSDNGLSQAQCNNIRAQNLGGSSSQGTLYNTLISLFNSHWVQFIPGQSQINFLGNYYATNSSATPTAIPQQSVSGNIWFNIYVAANNGADIVNIGQNSGQASQNYIYANSALRLACLFFLALLKFMI